MSHTRPALAALAAAATLTHLCLPLAAADAGDRFWPQWRGPSATGVSRSATPPLVWSETENVRWKIALPGRGSSTPVIWGDRVYVSTAVPLDGTGDRSRHRFVVMAVNRKDGSVVWEHSAREEAPHEGTHREFGTMASSSAVTDGEHVIASFESRGIFAFDMKGTLLWEADLGDKRMRNEFGEGSSPALYKDRVVVVWDHQGESFIVALDKATGKELWRTRRDEIDSWATPLVVEHGGRAQAITSGMNKVRAYDVQSGELIWETAGLTMNPIPSPVTDGAGVVFLTAGFRGNSLKAIRLEGAAGDITGTPNVVWTLDRDTPYVPSPLLYDGVLYILKSNNGLLSAFDAASGKPHYQVHRLDAVPSVFASPVGAAERVYIVGQEGTTVVLRHGPSVDVLATNSLDDRFDASPALVDGEMYLRGYEHLYCIAEN